MVPSLSSQWGLPIRQLDVFVRRRREGAQLAAMGGRRVSELLMHMGQFLQDGENVCFTSQKWLNRAKTRDSKKFYQGQGVSGGSIGQDHLKN